MDFSMIIGHSLSIQEIQKIDKNKELWNSIDEYLKAEINYSPSDKFVKWTLEPSQENLEEFWLKSRSGEDSNKLVEIDCYFGNITVFQYTIRIWFSNKFL